MLTLLYSWSRLDYRKYANVFDVQTVFFFEANRILLIKCGLLTVDGRLFLGDLQYYFVYYGWH